MPATPVPTSPAPAVLRFAQSCRDWDERRESFPGEHWIVLGAGIAVLLAANRSRSPLKRAIGSAIGGAMLVRAASGRDGIAKLLPYLPALPLRQRLR